MSTEHPTEPITVVEHPTAVDQPAVPAAPAGPPLGAWRIRRKRRDWTSVARLVSLAGLVALVAIPLIHRWGEDVAIGAALAFLIVAETAAHVWYG